MDCMIGVIFPWPLNWAPYGWLMCDGQQLSISQYTALYSLLGTTYGGDGRTYFNIPDLRGRFPVGVNSSPSVTPTSNRSQYVLGENGAGGVEKNSMAISTAGQVTLTEANIPVHQHTFTGTATSVNISANGNVDLSKGYSTVPATVDTSTSGAVSTPGNGLVLGPAKNTTSSPSNCNMYRNASSTTSNNINILANPLSGTAPVTATGTATITPAGTIGSPSTTVSPVTIQTSSGALNFDTRSPYLPINFIICVQGLYPDRP